MENIFHAKIQLFVTAKSDQDPDPDSRGSTALKPVRIRNTEEFLVVNFNVFLIAVQYIARLFFYKYLCFNMMVF